MYFSFCFVYIVYLLLLVSTTVSRLQKKMLFNTSDLRVFIALQFHLDSAKSHEITATAMGLVFRTIYNLYSADTRSFSLSSKSINSSIQQRKKRFLFVGRFVPQKVLISCWKLGRLARQPLPVGSST